MGLRINTNVLSLNAQRHLTNQSTHLARSYARLASGQRIAVAADDAAGLGIAGRMSARLRSLKVAQRNVLDGISVAQTAEGTLAELTGIIQRVRELAVRGANGSLSDLDRGSLDGERRELAEEAERIVSTASFNGRPLLGSGAIVSDAMEIQVGTDANDTIALALPDVARAALAIGAVSVATAGGARSSLRILDLAQEIVTDGRGELGASQRRLESAGRSLRVEAENLAAAHSRIMDLDYAEEAANLTRLQILQSAATSVLAQANVQPEVALQVLFGPS